MGDYNFCFPYTSPESKGKYCKYSYSSWCATCEKCSPRRRSRSEITDICKKKCREMKTATPKKYNKCTEYENMELEYDVKGWHETKYDCRIRSNLVELPTSYISNNCQMPPNTTLKNDVDCFKSSKMIDHASTVNFFDVKLPFESSEMKDSNVKILETGKLVSKHFPPNIEHHLSIASYVKSNGFQIQKYRTYSDNQDVQNGNCYSEGPRVNSSNCREYCHLVQFKGHDVGSRKPLCYNTDTYFNRSVDKEIYIKEVEYLRETLKILQNSAYTNPPDQGVSVVSLDTGKEDSLKNDFILTTIELKPKIFKKPAPVQILKNQKSKISLKTRKTNIWKNKIKSKSGNVPTDNFSDGSGSESDTVEDDSLDEGPDSISSNSDPVSTDDSTKDLKDAKDFEFNHSGSGESPSWPIRASLFPNIPPYIKFQAHDLDTPYKVPTGRKFFKWKLSTITPLIVRKTLTNSGFALVRKSNQWLGTWGKHMKSPMFKTLKETQKLNHFPGTFQLGRKDRLWRNFQKMISKYGQKEFGFLPHTYILPHELKLLKQNWDFKNNEAKEMWIIKPPASARGVGIKVINKWSQLPKKTSLVCQKYIKNPYLINGSKFDLRLYVLVTSFHPLRIYLYPEGLARFASVKYSGDVKDLKDRYMHLTNYSINKLSSQYTTNEDANACQGHKWTLSKLMEFMQDEGIDTKTLWKNLQQLVIKTIISSEALITPLCEENMNSYYNCYELFGIDVLLDEHLKPWLLEVNISPSLHSASPLDAHVKGPLVQTLFDMAQFHFPFRLGQNVKIAPQCFDGRIYARSLTKKERTKHVNFVQYESREDYVYDILKDLTGDDVRHLLRAEDEYVVKGNFERIFPTVHTYKYLNFMEPRYYNRLFDAWETKYASRREDGISLLQTLCAQKVHLKIGSPSTLGKNSQNMILGQTMNIQPSTDGQTRPLEEIMKETSISNKISNPCEEIKV